MSSDPSMIVCVGRGGSLVCTGFGTNWGFWHLLGILECIPCRWVRSEKPRSLSGHFVRSGRAKTVENRMNMCLTKRETLCTARQWHGGLQKQERRCCHLFTVCQSPLAPTGSLTLRNRRIYAKVIYKVVTCNVSPHWQLLHENKSPSDPSQFSSEKPR